MSRHSAPADLHIAGTVVVPGERRIVDLPVAPLYTHNDLHISAHVLRGRSEGPTLLVCAAIHGDEINGVEIIRRLLAHKGLERLRGTLVAIPVVNVHGFLNHSRYLPDGRDLNRAFPGSARGSLTGRIAHTFMQEVVSHCSHAIDLHTGARHRGNLPHIRTDMSDPTGRAMAEAFGVPVVLHAQNRDGSLRQAAADRGIPVLLYEAGEALRFDEVAIRAGVSGVLNVMRAIGMLPRSRRRQPAAAMITDQSLWIRAPASGVLRALVPLGAKAARGRVIGVIADPVGNSETEVVAPDDGIVIGRTFLPLVHEGEALFHLARFRRDTDEALSRVEAFQESLEPDIPLHPPEDPDAAPIAG